MRGQQRHYDLLAGAGRFLENAWVWSCVGAMEGTGLGAKSRLAAAFLRSLCSFLPQRSTIPLPPHKRFPATFARAFLCSQWRPPALPVSAVPPGCGIIGALQGTPGLQTP